MCKQMRDRREGLPRLVGFGGDDAEIELRQIARVVRGLQMRMKLVAPGDANAALVDSCARDLRRRAKTHTSATRARCAA